jgi:hypothetical protein
MKRRSSLINYVLTLITGGQFAFVWLFFMAFDVNEVKQNHVPRLNAMCTGFIILYVLYLLLVGYNICLIGTATAESYSSLSTRIIPIWPLLIMAVALLTCSIYLLLRIADFARQNGVSTLSNGVVVLLLFVYMISLPMLQNRLNRITGADQV